MKLKKILAVTLGTTIALSAAVALTACHNDGVRSLGTTTAFNIDDYIQDIDDVNSSLSTDNGVKSIVNINDSGETFVSQRNDNLIFRAGSSTSGYSYKVYNTTKEKFIISNQTVQPVIASIGSLTAIKLTDANGKTEYRTTDGDVLLSTDDYTSVYSSYSYYYIGADKKTTLVYKVTGKRNNADDVVAYFKEESNVLTGKTHLVSVNKSEIGTWRQDKYDVGNYANERNTIYNQSKLYPIEGDIMEYEYSVFNNTYKFYKGNNLTGSVTMEYGTSLGFVGNYMYYKTETPLSPDSTSYNYVVYDEGIVRKYDYKLHRYDIIANTTTTLNYDVKIDDTIYPVYNKTTKTCDAAMVDCYKMTDGVFIEGAGEEKSYVTDANLNIAVDATDKAGMPMYKLDDGVYLAGPLMGSGTFIVDGNFDYVTDATTENLFYNVKLIKYQVNGKYGLKDYSGKVVVSPKYGSISSFYNGYARATLTDDSGNTETVFLDASGEERKAPKSDENTTVTIGTRGWYSVTTNSSTSGNYNVAIYKYSGGEAIAGFSNISYSDVQSISLDSNIFVVGDAYYLVKY